jgi:hypothetical protein
MYILYGNTTETCIYVSYEVLMSWNCEYGSAKLWDYLQKLL